MRSKFIWLVPVLLLLIALIGSGNADAHSSLSSGLETTAAEHEDGENYVQVSVISADETGEPCDCPGGHCTCNVDCLAMCAATPAIAGVIVFDFVPVRAKIALETVNFSASWVPIRDFDPPRLIA